MLTKKQIEKFNKMALKTLVDIIESSDDYKVKISAIKELFGITLRESDNKSKGDTDETVIFKGDVDD